MHNLLAHRLNHMRFRIAAITVLTVLVVTGCSNERSATTENQVKLIQYEKCLLLEQESLNSINSEISRSESFSELVRILERQSTSRFEIHLKNCEKYRPLTLP